VEFRGGPVRLFDLTEETPHYVRGDKRGEPEETPRRFTPRDDLYGHFERSEKSPPFMFRVELEEGKEETPRKVGSE